MARAKTQKQLDIKIRSLKKQLRDAEARRKKAVVTSKKTKPAKRRPVRRKAVRRKPAKRKKAVRRKKRR